MKLQTVLIVAVLCVGAGVLAGLAIAGQESSEPPPVGDVSADGNASVPELRGTSTELQRAQRDLVSERTRREALEAQLAALRCAAVKPAASEAGVRDARAPRFVYDGLEDALTKPDWGAAGEAVNKLQPLIAKLRLALSRGEDPSAHVAQIQRWNSTILGMAMMAKSAGVPGTGVNGAYSHPVVMVNLIHSTLENAGEPLEEAQAERLGMLGDKYLREDRARISGYTGDALQIEKVIGEAALRDRFFADADQLLSEVQRNVLHPESVRGRLSVDLFSSGILWGPLVRPIPFDTREDLATAWSERLQRAYGFDAAFAPALADSVADWTRGFSDAYLATSDDPHARGGGALAGKLTGWFLVKQVRVAAERQRALTRALIERLPADSPLIEKLRGRHRIAVPMKRPAK